MSRCDRNSPIDDFLYLDLLYYLLFFWSQNLSYAQLKNVFLFIFYYELYLGKHLNRNMMSSKGVKIPLLLGSLFILIWEEFQRSLKSSFFKQ